jgi:DNA-binding transcriptional LysR family regulator
VELRQVRYFDMAVREGNFGRAAVRLGVVEEALGSQIRLLERELAAELFDRSSRRMHLTAVGERFLPEARALLAAEERALAVVAGLTRGGARTLRLGTGTGLGAHLDRVLDAHAQLAPATSVELVAAPAGQRLDLVADRQLDAAFVRGTPSGDG